MEPDKDSDIGIDLEPRGESTLLNFLPVVNSKAVVNFHLACVFPAIALGAVQFQGPSKGIFRAGIVRHRFIGRTYSGLMAGAIVSSFWLQAPHRNDTVKTRNPFDSSHQFSWIHGLSVFTAGCIVRGVRAIRVGDVGTHKRCMRGTYLGMMAAGAMAAIPSDRRIGAWMRGANDGPPSWKYLVD